MFEDKLPLNRPYYEAIRIAIDETDWPKAEEMERTRLSNIEEMKRKGYNTANKEFKMRPDHHIIAFVPESACNRLFNDSTVGSVLGYQGFEWESVQKGRYVEHGDFNFMVGDRVYVMDLKSRQLYGKIDNGWCELNDAQSRKKVDGYIFSAFDRVFGIVYLLGYLLYDDFQKMKDDYFESKLLGTKDDHGLEFIEAGRLTTGGQVARRSYWKIPYCMINRFNQPLKYGNFQLAQEEVALINYRYPNVFRTKPNKN